MTLKEKIENNLTLFTLSVVAASFAAGFGAYKALADASAGQAVSSTPSVTNWEESARNASWIPKTDCSAYPVSVAITSPGEGSVVEYSSAGPIALQMDTVIQASRPLPEGATLGIVANEEGTTNYYVLFPSFSFSKERRIFRDGNFFFLPFTPKDGAHVQLWAIVVDDKTKFGNVYGSLEQVKASGNEVTVSPRLSFSVKMH